MPLAGAARLLVLFATRYHAAFQCGCATLRRRSQDPCHLRHFALLNIISLLQEARGLMKFSLDLSDGRHVGRPTSVDKSPFGFLPRGGSARWAGPLTPI